MTWFDQLFGNKREVIQTRSRSRSGEMGLDTASSADAVDSDHRSVHVFVSSTFLDMQAERRELVTKTFPALRAKYRARGVEIFEVDLRWGITREMQERGDTLSILLAEIDRCRPYFIGLMGDRYGSIPEKEALTPKLKEDYPALVSAQDMSVTAIEILHGVLTNPDTAARAIFFERDPHWDWVSTLDAPDRAGVTAENDNARAKLAEIKTQIRNKARVVRYDRPDEIQQKAFDALDHLLEARFPEQQAPDRYQQTEHHHRAYARERCGLHVGADGYLRDLSNWMEARNAPPKLVTGASGAGKSTLIANWLHSWRKARPNDLVFEHYVAANPDSADPILLMRRLWEFLNRATRDIVDLPVGGAELMDVSERLNERLVQARGMLEREERRLLVAVDGLDKLSGEQDLRWLPLVLGVHVLASSLDGEAKSAASRESTLGRQRKCGHFLDRRSCR
jgi:nephrocystin-3